MTKATMGTAKRAASRVLGRDAILAVEDRQRELVEVPEWGGSVWAYGLSGAERDAFEESILEVKADKGGKVHRRTILANLRAKLCARSMCDEEGERLFSDGEVNELGKKSARALDRVFQVAQRLNGIGEDDIEELAGNSD